MGGVFRDLTYDATIDTLYPKPKLEEVTLDWVNGYKDVYYNPELFNPHFTTGFGVMDATDTENFGDIYCPTIALCWLGNYCTVRQVLAECFLMG